MVYIEREPVYLCGAQNVSYLFVALGDIVPRDGFSIYERVYKLQESTYMMFVCSLLLGAMRRAFCPIGCARVDYILDCANHAIINIRNKGLRVKINKKGTHDFSPLD
jgi:hypothetical protein